MNSHEFDHLSDVRPDARRMSERELARFLAKIAVEDKVHPVLGTACWRWTGAGVACQTGLRYGVLRCKRNGRFVNVLAHVLSFDEWTSIEVPVGFDRDHLCRNTMCPNPDHLEAVPHSVNISRGSKAGPKVPKSHCPKGHPFAGNNVRIYMTPLGARSMVCRTCEFARRAAKRRVA